ncbi:MAG: hypothetical protein KC910_12375 [Candidatus Eremiobacteraeota bacterium]|nr:hypothetical protein [Candidatus Eremiobacteraeota bacterium]
MRDLARVLALADTALRRGEYIDCVRMCHEALTQTSDARLHRRLGLAARELGWLEQALSAFDQVCQDDPDDLDARHQRMQLNASLGNHSAVLIDSDLLLEYHDGLDFQTMRGRACLDQGRFEDAARAFRSAGLAELEGEALFRLACQQWEAGNYQQAWSNFDRAEPHIQDPRSLLTLYFQRQRIHARLGHLDSALADIGRALAQAEVPHKLKVLLLCERAELHSRLGEDEPARAALEQARQLDPDSPVVNAYQKGLR